MQGWWECRSDDVAQLEEGGQEEFGSDQVSGETFVGLSSTSESGPCFKKRGGWQWLALRVCPASKKGWLAVAGSGIGGGADGWQPPAEYITSENTSFQ